MKPEDVDAWVLDASAFAVVIEVGLSGSAPGAAFKRLMKMVSRGRIAIPRQVVKQINAIAEVPWGREWVKGFGRPDDQGNQYIRRVMLGAGEVADPYQIFEESDPAAPWVLSQALLLQAQEGSAGVVTEDVADGHRLSMATACGRLGLAWVRTKGFLEECGIPVKAEGGGG